MHVVHVLNNGQETDDPNKKTSIGTFNRNFSESHYDGNPLTHDFVSSPEITTVLACMF